MSVRHPIISVTGSSGAGTTTVKQTFERIFHREGLKAAWIEGYAFHRYDRAEMRRVMAEEASAGNPHFSHFGPAANLLNELEQVFAEYGRNGGGRTRHYVHDDLEAARLGVAAGSFTDWANFPLHTNLLFYEGLHGAVVTEEVNIARHADLKIGVVPVINLEWNPEDPPRQVHPRLFDRGGDRHHPPPHARLHPLHLPAIHRDRRELPARAMRVPMVDTSNPFVARWIPTPDESMVVIRFRSPRGIDFAYLTSMLQGSFMSRANSIVVPGGKLDLAMQLILTPMILQLIERGRRAR